MLPLQYNANRSILKFHVDQGSNNIQLDSVGYTLNVYNTIQRR